MPAEPSHEVRASREEGRTNPVPAKSTKALSTCSRLQRCGTSLDFRSSGGAYCSGALLRYVRATLSLCRDVRWCVVNCARVRAGKTSAQPSVWTSGDSKQRWLCDSATAVTTTLCLYTVFQVPRVRAGCAFRQRDSTSPSECACIKTPVVRCVCT